MKKYYLILENEQMQKSIFPLEGSVTIGRSSKCEITLTDHAVSRSHARMRFQKNSWVIEDLGSSNGIIFAGERVAKKALQTGETFTIGRTTLRFAEADSLAEVEQLFDTLEKFATTIMYESALLLGRHNEPRSKRLQEALRSTPIFEYLGDEELEVAAAAANLHLFSEGKAIIREGGKDRSLYIVLDGRVKVFTEDTSGKEVQLATLGRNQFFGEVALMTGKLRSTSVAAMEKCLLMEFTYSSMRRLMLRYPQVNKMLQNSLQVRVEDTRKKRADAGIEDRPPP
jgi:hypothetical protein